MVKDTTTKLLLRPESLILSDKDIHSEIGNQKGIPGRITNRTYAGEQTYYQVDMEGLVLRVSVIGKGTWQRGDSIFVFGKEKQLIVCKKT